MLICIKKKNKNNNARILICDFPMKFNLEVIH